MTNLINIGLIYNCEECEDTGEVKVSVNGKPALRQCEACCEHDDFIDHGVCGDCGQNID